MSKRNAVLSSAIALALTVTSTFFAPATPANAAEDPLLGWQHEAIKSNEAHAITKGKGVIVGVIDSGVSEHPYFADKSFVEGKDYGSGKGRNDNDSGHGTAMAGAVLAVAPEASIMSLKPTIDDDFTAITAAEETATIIDWAIERDVDVLSMSWGINDDNPKLRMALQRAINNDVVLVAAAGNDSVDVVKQEGLNVPANYPGVITVSAVDQNHELASFSNYGSAVVLAAPGTEYTSLKNQVPYDKNDITKPNPDKTLYLSNTQGTSPAAATVAGAVALARAAHPDLDANNVIQLLTSTAKDLGDPGRDDRFGFGMVDANAAVTADVKQSDMENPLGYPMGTPGDPDELLAGPVRQVSSEEQAGRSDSTKSPMVRWVGIGITATALIGAVIVFVIGRRRHAGSTATR